MVMIIMTCGHKRYDLKVTTCMTYFSTLYNHKVSNYFLSNLLTTFFLDMATIVFVKYLSLYNSNWNLYIT